MSGRVFVSGHLFFCRNQPSSPGWLMQERRLQPFLHCQPLQIRIRWFLPLYQQPPSAACGCVHAAASRRTPSGSPGSLRFQLPPNLLRRKGPPGRAALTPCKMQPAGCQRFKGFPVQSGLHRETVKSLCISYFRSAGAGRYKFLLF